MSQAIPKRHKTHMINAGGLLIGCESPVSIQTMWKKPLKSVDTVLINKIKTLKYIGCEILRFAVPNLKTVSLLRNLIKVAPLPIVADIHFDYKIALACMDINISKIRINPGNIGAKWKVREVVNKAEGCNIPIRIGVNSGSLPENLQNEKNPYMALVKAAEEELDIFEELKFRDIVFSLKASDIETTIQANKIFAAKHRYPLHLGITEAGPIIPGIIKSTIAISQLLKEGIGDTIRVSLSDSPEKEILAAKEILSSSGIRKIGPDIISCPLCGRSSFNTIKFLKEIEDYLLTLEKPIKIAVMGCPVNGPGEARHADIGITGEGNSAVIFKHGKPEIKVSKKDALKVFIEEIEKM